MFEKFFVAVRAVQASPGLFRIIESDVRRIHRTRFPYHLYFRVKNDCVRFLLLMHTARTPEAVKRQLRTAFCRRASSGSQEEPLELVAFLKAAQRRRERAPVGAVARAGVGEERGP